MTKTEIVSFRVSESIHGFIMKKISIEHISLKHYFEMLILKDMNSKCDDRSLEKIRKQARSEKLMDDTSRELKYTIKKMCLLPNLRRMLMDLSGKGVNGDRLREVAKMALYRIEAVHGKRSSEYREAKAWLKLEGSDSRTRAEKGYTTASLRVGSLGTTKSKKPKRTKK